MTCEELSLVYELYALGLADEPERTELQQHLARGCPVCTAGMRRARAFNTAMLTLTPETNPPARLRRRILASVGDEPGRGWIWSWAAMAAAVAVVAVIYGVQTARAHRELAIARAELQRTASDLVITAADRARMQQALQLLDQPDTEEVSFGGSAPKPPRGRVIVNPHGGVLLLVVNLPPAPAGRTYEMWLLPKTGAPAPAGVFQSEESGAAVYFRPGPVDRAATAGIAVSVEPAAGSAAPTTTPIIIAKL